MKKLKRATDKRIALVRGLATNLLWYGEIETTKDKAKAVQSVAEKILSKAIATHKDTKKVTKTVIDDKGVSANKEVIVDGPKKLAARRAIMAKLYDIQEVRADKESKADYVARTKDIKHPLIEKIFNEYAPKYENRANELGIGGGYTRILNLGPRKGDNAQMVKIQLV